MVVGFGVNLAAAPALADRDAVSLAWRQIAPEAFAPLLAGALHGCWRYGATEAPRW